MRAQRKGPFGCGCHCDAIPTAKPTDRRGLTRSKEMTATVRMYGIYSWGALVAVRRQSSATKTQHQNPLCAIFRSTFDVYVNTFMHEMRRVRVLDAVVCGQSRLFGMPHMNNKHTAERSARCVVRFMLSRVHCMSGTPIYGVRIDGSDGLPFAVVDASIGAHISASSLAISSGMTATPHDWVDIQHAMQVA